MDGDGEEVVEEAETEVEEIVGRGRGGDEGDDGALPGMLLSEIVIAVNKSIGVTIPAYIYKTCSMGKCNIKGTVMRKNITVHKPIINPKRPLPIFKKLILLYHS